MLVSVIAVPRATNGRATPTERLRPAAVISSPTLLRFAPTPFIAADASSTSLRTMERVVLEQPMKALYRAARQAGSGTILD
jgi:hypothetical protein